MTLNGHVGGDGVGYLKSTGVEGNVVHQMVFNSQFETNGGNGWIRVLEFLERRHDGRMSAPTRRSLTSTAPTRRTTFTSRSRSCRLSSTPPPILIATAFVDGDDLTVWKPNFGVVGSATVQTGDADGDLDVDGADFLLWQQQFTGSAPATATQAAVPEPSALLLAVGGASLMHALPSSRIASSASHSRLEILAWRFVRYWPFGSC